MAEETNRLFHFNSKKTAVLAVWLAAVFVFPSVLIASNATITKAKNLSLQRDRIQATKLLRDAISQKKENSKEAKKLKKALDKFSSIFYTAKALQAYETGRSFFDSNELQAKESFEEAHKLEKQNIKPMLALAEFNLKTNDCSEAMSWVEKAGLVNPYNKKHKYLKLFAMACLGKAEEIKKLKAQLEPMVKKDYYLLSLAQAYIQEGEWKKSEGLLLKIKDRKLPELHYFKGVIARSTDKESYLEDFANYVGLCRDLERARKKYPYDPRICRESANIRKKYQLPAGGSLQKVVK
jgi:tetratricopeptide (TPR) repeat protein